MRQKINVIPVRELRGQNYGELRGHDTIFQNYGDKNYANSGVIIYSGLKISRTLKKRVQELR